MMVVMINLLSLPAVRSVTVRYIIKGWLGGGPKKRDGEGRDEKKASSSLLILIILVMELPW
jgi:hypothetical protein